MKWGRLSPGPFDDNPVRGSSPLSSWPHEDETEVYDWDRGLLVKGDYSMIDEARREVTDEMEVAARDEDLVERAQTNAEESIGSFVRSLGFERVVFT
jgi:hypothetical protein